MPRQAQGPRLVLLKGRLDARSGKPLPDIWFIRDGQVKRSTGCVDDGSGRPPPAAERELAAYIASKWSAPAPDIDEAKRRSDPAQVFVDEVLALYVLEKAPRTADVVSVKGRVKALRSWWTGKKLSDVRRSTCEAYVRDRTTQPIKSFREGAEDPKPLRCVSEQGARRELEDLSAAIGWWDKEYHLSRRPTVVKPSKPETPRDALTRSEAAALLLAAMGWRKGKSGRWTRVRGCTIANRRHLRRFVLISVYSGSRSGVTKALLWNESATHAYVDLDDAYIYRRGKAERDHATKRRPLVKMSPRLLAHMRRWAAMDEKLNLERKENELAPIVSVLHRAGAPIGSVKKGFASLVKDAGLDPAITPHWLRHTAATWLMQADAKPWDAAAYMGMTVTTLEEHYGHHRPNHQADTAARAGRGGR